MKPALRWGNPQIGVGALLIVMMIAMLAALKMAFNLLDEATAPGAVSMSLPAHSQNKISDAYLLDRHGLALHRLRVDHSVRQLQWVLLPSISAALV